MFLYSLLDVSDKTTNIVKWVSVAAVALLLGVIAFIGYMNRGKHRYDARRIAFAGICVSMSFVLSTFAKFDPVPNGGSVTIASAVPILIYAYVYGVAEGLMVGLIHGLLNFVVSPFILTPLTFILDYLLAFASVGVMGIAGRFTKKTTFNVVLGTLAAFALRFVFHLLSGVIFFAHNSIWVELPQWALSNGFVYSFIYQCIYLPADCAIAAVAMYVLAKVKVTDALAAMMRPRRAADPQARPADEA